MTREGAGKRKREGERLSGREVERWRASIKVWQCRKSSPSRSSAVEDGTAAGAAAEDDNDGSVRDTIFSHVWPLYV